jgi:hypothetical protein
VHVTVRHRQASRRRCRRYPAGWYWRRSGSCRRRRLAVAVDVGLVDVGRARAVVAGIALRIAVDIALRPVGEEGAVVVNVPRRVVVAVPIGGRTGRRGRMVLSHTADQAGDRHRLAARAPARDDVVEAVPRCGHRPVVDRTGDVLGVEAGFVVHERRRRDDRSAIHVVSRRLERMEPLQDSDASRACRLVDPERIPHAIGGWVSVRLAGAQSETLGTPSLSASNSCQSGIPSPS